MENNISPAPNNAPNQSVEPPKENQALPGLTPPVQQPEDPDYLKWVQDTKDLKTAYKRYSDSSKEALRQKEASEAIAQQAKQHAQYIADLTEEVKAIQQADPELLKKWQETVMKIRQGATTPSNQPQPAMTVEQVEQRAMQAAEFKVELNKFFDEYGRVISNDKERVSIMQMAKNFESDGVIDPQTQKPYTLRGALLAATKLHHPELLNKPNYASMARRDSAAESGDLPLGGSSSSPNEELTPEEAAVAARLGITPQDYAKFRR